MLSFEKKDKRTEARKEYDSILSKMKQMEDKSCKAYKDLADSAEKTLKLDSDERFTKNRRKPSPDAVLSAEVYFAGLVFVAAWENRHIISAKMWNIIQKIRI